MAAYVVDLTANTLTKNGVAIPNILSINVTIGVGLEVTPNNPTPPQTGFDLHVRVHDTAADARVLAQGPAGLLGSNVAAFAGKPAEYVIHSQIGDTLALHNVPATIAAGSGIASTQPQDAYSKQV